MDSNLKSMAKKSILLIGAGQLGSRHLQALALIKESCEIYLIDPSEQSLKLARQRFEQIEGFQRHQLKQVASLDGIGIDELDLAIVATNSAIRADVTQELLNRKKINYLILEKFLFQRLSDYAMITRILEQKCVKAFVNCPRRMFPTYQKVKALIGNMKNLQMEVVGNSWGLGCNGVHFIDLFQWLSCTDIENWDNHLDEGYFDSKRSGYIEFGGNILGKSKEGAVLRLTSYTGGPANISVRISTKTNRFVVGESVGKVWQENIGEENVELLEMDFEMKFQSALTNLVAEELFKTGTCGLTHYSDSVQSHTPFLELLLKHYNESRKEKTDVCPIT